LEKQNAETKSRSRTNKRRPTEENAGEGFILFQEDFSPFVFNLKPISGHKTDKDKPSSARRFYTEQQYSTESPV
jgi:hypothetical protein